MPSSQRTEGLSGALGKVMAVPGVSPPWQAALLRLSLCWGAFAMMFRDDWRAMASQWWNISTYTHVLLVPAIVVWLVALRARQLLMLAPRCWWPGVIALAVAALLWVLGRLAGLAEVSEAGAVAMMIACVPLLLGVRIGAGLAFPLFYMVFLVPFGDELIPLLQVVTARLTIVLMRLSGVSAAIDGVFIHTPAGLFEIAEACSGVKFLIAMIAFGVLAAHLCFAGWRRRAAFLAACVVVPVLANGVRAWGTVYVAQFRGAAWAGGFDHIVYGWIFFAIVMACVLAGAWRFFDRPARAPAIDAGRLNASPRLARMERLSTPPVPALGLALGVAVLAQLWVGAAGSLHAPMPDHIDLPAVPGWQRVDYAPRHGWEPRAKGAEHRLLGRYADGEGHQVDVFFALYSAQGEGVKADGFGEGALIPHSGWAWQGRAEAPVDASGERLLTVGPLARIAQTTYRTGDLATGSGLALRLAVLRDKLLMRPASTMMLILSSEEAYGKPAEASLAAFRRSIGPAGIWMDRIATSGEALP